MRAFQKIAQTRSCLKQSIRKFFDSRGFLELDTPILVPSPGVETHLGYFKTRWIDHQQKSHVLWMRSSPELAMKRAIVEGLPAVYQLASSFRNEGELSPWHHPEFTMLEFYKVTGDWKGFIQLTEELIRFSCKEMAKVISVAMTGNETLHYLTLEEAFLKFADIKLIDEDGGLAEQAKAKGVISVQKTDDFETAFYKVLLEKIEPALSQMGWVVLHDYPPSQAALARVVGGVAKRFEFYINGVELSNGFYELCDLAENKKRIQESNILRKALGKDVPQEDLGFYDALAKGLPECVGNAVGFDRLLALILGAQDLCEVIPFRNDPPFL